MEIVAVDTFSGEPPSCARNKEEPWPRLTFENLENKPSLYLVAVSQEKAKAATAFLNKTTTLCPDKVNPGAFRRENMLIFWMPDCERDLKSGVRKFLLDQNIQKHPKAITIRSISSSKSLKGTTLLSWRYNVFSKTLSSFLLGKKELENNLSKNLLVPYIMEVCYNNFWLGCSNSV